MDDGPKTADGRPGAILIEHGALVFHDGSALSETAGWLAVEGDHIAALGAGDAPEEWRARAGRILNARHMAVLPGLVNGHTHLAQTFLRGLADDRSLLRWLKEVIWPAQAAMTPEDQYLAALLGLVENLRCGATTVVQHHKLPGRDHVAAAAQAAARVGLRMVLARGWADWGSNGEPIDHILADMQWLYETWHNRPFAGDARSYTLSGRPAQGDTVDPITPRVSAAEGVDPVILRPPMSRGDMRETHELRRVIASEARRGLPGRAKQSPSQVMDCFVANHVLSEVEGCAPRNDGWKFMSSGAQRSEESRGRIRVASGPLAPWRCSDDAMRQITTLTRSWGVPTHIHVAETQDEVDMLLQRCGRRHIEWLADLGCLDADTQLVHAVHVTDTELDLIAQSGATVVHCPTSNMYLASGAAPVRKMLDRGIPVALGTDGSGSNNSQDLLECAKIAALLAKHATGDAQAMLPADVVQMLTVSGARLWNTAWQSGARLIAGAPADITIVNLNNPRCQPVHSAASALVYNASGANVHTVIVDGRILLDAGRVTMLDEEALLEECRHAAGRLMTRAEILTASSRSAT